MAVFQQKWLYLDKITVFGQTWLYFIWIKRSYLDKSGSIWTNFVVFEQNGSTFWPNTTNFVQIHFVVVFGQTLLYLNKIRSYMDKLVVQLNWARVVSCVGQKGLYLEKRLQVIFGHISCIWKKLSYWTDWLYLEKNCLSWTK